MPVPKEIQALIDKLIAFRDWKQFHNPKDLAAALSIEASELQEIMSHCVSSVADLISSVLWKKPDEVDATVSKKPERITEEVADIGAFLLLLCHELDIDLLQAISDKIDKNAAKYPVEKSKGTHAKYDEL